MKIVRDDDRYKWWLFGGWDRCGNRPISSRRWGRKYFLMGKREERQREGSWWKETCYEGRRKSDYWQSQWRGKQGIGIEGWVSCWGERKGGGLCSDREGRKRSDGGMRLLMEIEAGREGRQGGREVSAGEGTNGGKSLIMEEGRPRKTPLIERRRRRE